VQGGFRILVVLECFKVAMFKCCYFVLSNSKPDAELDIEMKNVAPDQTINEIFILANFPTFQLSNFPTNIESQTTTIQPMLKLRAKKHGSCAIGN